MIDLNGITLIRDHRTILRNVSWRVRDGEHWALVGANGAGKTTLLQVVCGTLWPTEGDVRVLGRRYGETDLRRLRREIGWFSAALEPRISPREPVRDLVASGKFATLGLVFDRPTAADRRRAGELLDVMGCSHVAGQAFGTLSQGERQKALLCRALMPDPRLLILDEPCTGLDLAARERLLDSVERLGRLRDQGPTLIMVTHHIEEITPAFSRVLLLRDGSVAAQGRKADVLTAPLLSDALGVRLSVRRAAGRFWVSLRRRSGRP
ncbi:MAG: ABC transporter ATP-binding protein [Phycisphaerae bacterium]|nr:ABC transporter ATP-binding protein [Phycisphaerae bacterium]